MENLKENLQELKSIDKKIARLDAKIKELIETDRNIFSQNNYTEFLAQVEKNENEIKALKSKIETLGTQKSIIKNNIHYLFKIDLQEIETEVINELKTKRIGDKTKEKLENKIKDYFKTNYGVNVGGYILNDGFAGVGKIAYKLTLYFLSKEGYKDYSLGYNEEFEKTYELVTAQNNVDAEEEAVRYNHKIDNYVEIAETLKLAKQLQKEHKKAKAEIEKLRQKQKEIYHNFRDNLQGFLYHNLDIETDLHIY